MNIFKTFALKWWEAALFKVGLLAVGLAVGSCLHALLAPYLLLFIIVAVLCLGYVTYVWWRQ